MARDVFNGDRVFDCESVALALDSALVNKLAGVGSEASKSEMQCVGEEKCVHHIFCLFFVR